MPLADDRCAIAALVHAYAERIDAGDLDGVAALLRDAVWRSPARPDGVQGLAAIRALYADVILYDGTPCTQHAVSNLTIELDGAAAHARSRFTVLQARPDFPLQPIAAGRYHDGFTRKAECGDSPSGRCCSIWWATCRGICRGPWAACRRSPLPEGPDQVDDGFGVGLVVEHEAGAVGPRVPGAQPAAGLGRRAAHADGVDTRRRSTRSSRPTARSRAAVQLGVEIAPAVVLEKDALRRRRA